MDNNTQGHRDLNHEEGQPSRMHTVEVYWTQKVNYNSTFELLNLPCYMGVLRVVLTPRRKGILDTKPIQACFSKSKQQVEANELF